MPAKYRKYCVRAGMSGRVIVDVPLGAISLRGEKSAVVAYAWLQLMGKDELGKDVNKHSETRHFIQAEILSRYEMMRGEVYERFFDKIKYYPMRNVEK